MFGLSDRDETNRWIAEGDGLRDLWRTYRGKWQMGCGPMKVALPSRVSELVPLADIPIPLNAECQTLVFDFEDCFYVMEGDLYRWWNVIVDGRVIDMEWQR